MALRFVPALMRPMRIIGSRSMSQVGDFGEGSGKGGGAGGDIRSAGGAFGKMEAAHEEEYFRKLRAQQLQELKKHMKQEMKEHYKENIEQLEQQVKAEEETIARHKKRIAELKKKADSDSD
ncbi:hypothetical protein ACF0H5_022810 [Mactra antiquata]